MKYGIYGTGSYSSLLWDWCKAMGIRIDFFAQTQEPVGSELRGLPLLPFDDLRKFQGELTMLLALQDAEAGEAVKKMFSRLSSETIRVFDMRGFIEENLLRRDALPSAGGGKYCLVCKGSPESFAPGGMKEELFQKHHIIGGGYRQNCICPLCGASDRERWLNYVLTKFTDIEQLEGRILHFAPENSLREWIASHAQIDYYTGDLTPSRAMHVTDITDIQYRDETFDYVICNHVMEHIPDEEKAVSEIKRVLKKEGVWIFSFPICTDMDTYEDPAITDPQERLKKYGQEDHVRLYGRDFKARFERYGLELQVFRPFEILTEEEIAKYGFIRDDVTILAKKKC